MEEKKPILFCRAGFPIGGQRPFSALAACEQYIRASILGFDFQSPGVHTKAFTENEHFKTSYKFCAILTLRLLFASKRNVRFLGLLYIIARGRNGMRFSGTLSKLPKRSRASGSAVERLPGWRSIRAKLEAGGVDDPANWIGWDSISPDALESVGLDGGQSGRLSVRRFLTKEIKRYGLSETHEVSAYTIDGKHVVVAKLRAATKGKKLK